MGVGVVYAMKLHSRFRVGGIGFREWGFGGWGRI